MLLDDQEHCHKLGAIGDAPHRCSRRCKPRCGTKNRHASETVLFRKVVQATIADPAGSSDYLHW
jgi:hypothetical protein